MNKNHLYTHSLFWVSRLIVIFFMPPILSDTYHYHALALKMLDGFLPYIDFTFEYPPLSILPIFLPAWITNIVSIPAISQYRTTFMLMTLVFEWLIFRNILNRNSKNALFFLLMSSCLLPFSLERLDVPMVYLMLMAALSYDDKEYKKALLFSTLGGWIKLIPFMTYLGVLNDRVNLVKRLTWILLINMCILTFLSSVFYSNLFQFLKYHADRPFQIESVVSSFVLFASHFSDFSLTVMTNFGSQNVYFPTHEIFLSASSILLILSFALVVVFFIRHNSDIKIVDLCCVLLFLLLCFSKVLSDQYFLWILPFIFCSRFFHLFSRLDKLLFSLIYLSTLIIFTNYFALIVNKNFLGHLLLLSRNLLLIYFTFKITLAFFKKRNTNEESLA